jgi:hypothetical protein
MPEFPDADQLADVFQLGTAVGPVERMGTGWGGHNVLCRLTTTSGHWAIKQVRRDPGPDVNAAMAIELGRLGGRRADAAAGADERGCLLCQRQRRTVSLSHLGGWRPAPVER